MRSVRDWISVSYSFWSSSGMPLALPFLTWSMPSRRTLRIETRALSAYCAATLVSSRRRSSFSSGIGSMMIVPIGLRICIP
ncbi:hypothetical protein MGSAQ_001316 [marine sediment metagenome]|uniref:Uncharacterized protein n=1 Tax=marine sediment metagenome TaxID=412755 RepID=A0A1B6NV02_9ZZZZ